MKKTTYIYCLKSPLTGEIKYIGKSNDPSKRLTQHIQDAKKGKTKKDRWINSLLTKNTTPVMEILEEVPVGKWQASERKWIKSSKMAGMKLLNKAPGGVYIPKYKRRRKK